SHHTSSDKQTFSLLQGSVIILITESPMSTDECQLTDAAKFERLKDSRSVLECADPSALCSYCTTFPDSGSQCPIASSLNNAGLTHVLPPQPSPPPPHPFPSPPPLPPPAVRRQMLANLEHRFRILPTSQPPRDLLHRHSLSIAPFQRFHHSMLHLDHLRRCL